MSGPKFVKKPRVYHYSNYREFLSDWFLNLNARSITSRISIKKFSSQLGLRSSNTIHRVLKGKGNLSPVNVERLCQTLRLNRHEVRFFRTLVGYNQAKSLDERKFFLDQMMQFRPYKNSRYLRSERYYYNSRWYYSAIRELIATGNFKEDPGWIARQFRVPLETRYIKKALRHMETLGVIQRGRDGLLMLGKSPIYFQDNTSDTSEDLLSKGFLSLATTAIEEIDRRERRCNYLTCNISPKMAGNISNEIRRFQKYLHLLIAKDKLDGKQVYHINLQIFPLTGRK